MSFNVNIPNELRALVHVLKSNGLSYRDEEPFTVKLSELIISNPHPITFLIGNDGSSRIAEIKQLVTYNHMIANTLKGEGAEIDDQAYHRIIAVSASPFALINPKFVYDRVVKDLQEANRLQSDDKSAMPSVYIVVDKLAASAKMEVYMAALSSLLYSNPNQMQSFFDGDHQNQIIIPVTQQEYNKIMEQLPDLETRSNRIVIPEASSEKIKTSIIYDLKKRDLIESDSALENELTYLIEMSNLYVKNLVQPGAAIKLAEVAYTLSEEKEINRKSIDAAVKSITNIDAELFSQSVSDIEKYLKEKIVGQDLAIKSIAKGIKRGTIVGIDERPRPIYSVMIYGESGIGKTLIAETLSQMISGNKRFLRIDAGELKSAELANARLLGMPIGYRGYEQGGAITEFARNHSSGVILVDEVEKAAPEVQDLFMRMIDTGSVTSAVGDLFDLTKYVFVFTTNAGTNKEATVGFSTVAPKSNPMKDLEGSFKPEFLNRFDDLLEFKPLNHQELSIIAMRTIENMLKNSQEQGFKIKLGKRKIQTLAKEVAENVTNGRQAYKHARTRFLDDYLVK